jgi:hypothetical protein
VPEYKVKRDNPAVGHRRLVRHAKISYLSAINERDTARPPDCSGFLPVPERKDAGVGRYGGIGIGLDTKFLQPCGERLAWEFIGIPAQDPVMARLGPGSWPMRFLLEAAWLLEEPSSVGLDQASHIRIVGPVMDDDKIIVATAGMMQHPRQQVALTIDADGKCQFWHETKQVLARAFVLAYRLSASQKAMFSLAGSRSWASFFGWI